jgi:hypothetical protein
MNLNRRYKLGVNDCVLVIDLVLDIGVDDHAGVLLRKTIYSIS